MRPTLPLIAVLALAGCGTVTPIVVTPTTAPTASQPVGVATLPTAPSKGPFAGLVGQYELDLTASLNAAEGPPADTLGVNFFTDLINLNNAIAVPSSTPSQACTPCILLAVERARQHTAPGANSVITLARTAIQSGNLYAADTKLRGLQLGADLQALLVGLEQSFVGL